MLAGRRMHQWHAISAFDSRSAAMALLHLVLAVVAWSRGVHIFDQTEESELAFSTKYDPLPIDSICDRLLCSTWHQ